MKAASAGYLELSLNGGPWVYLRGGDTTSFFAINNNPPLAIGSWPATSANCYTLGFIDEVRIAEVCRSADWMRAQYLSMNGEFIAFSSESQLCP